MEQNNDVRYGFWKTIGEWILDLLTEEYEITIWFTKETQINQHGLKSIVYGDAKVFKLRRLDKLTQTHIKGKDINGNPFEIKTSEPFNFNVKQVR